MFSDNLEKRFSIENTAYKFYKISLAGCDITFNYQLAILSKLNKIWNMYWFLKQVKRKQIRITGKTQFKPVFSTILT